MTFGGIKLSFINIHDNNLVTFIDNLSILKFTFYYEEYCAYENISVIFINFMITFMGYFILTLFTIIIDYYVFIDKFYKYYKFIKRKILLLNSEYKDEQDKYEVFSFINMIKEFFVALLCVIIALIVLNILWFFSDLVAKITPFS